AEMESANHFDALAVHWSANHFEVNAAYEKLLKEISPESRKYKTAPKACDRMRARAEAAFAVIGEDASRIAYRKKTIGDVDGHMVNDLLTGTIDSLEQRGAVKEAAMTRTT